MLRRRAEKHIKTPLHDTPRTKQKGGGDVKRHPLLFFGQSEPAAIGAINFPHLVKLTFTPFRHCYYMRNKGASMRDAVFPFMDRPHTKTGILRTKEPMTRPKDRSHVF